MKKAREENGSDFLSVVVGAGVAEEENGAGMGFLESLPNVLIMLIASRRSSIDLKNFATLSGRAPSANRRWENFARKGTSAAALIVLQALLAAKRDCAGRKYNTWRTQSVLSVAIIVASVMELLA